MMLSVKVKFAPGNEIRRARFVEPKTFVELLLELEKAFDVSNRFGPKYVVKYVDDEGDLVSMYSDEELKEALRQAREESAKFVLHLRIEKERANARPVRERLGQLPEMISNVMEQIQGSGKEGEGVPPFLSNAINEGLKAFSKNPEGMRAKAEEMLRTLPVKVMTPFICDSCDGAVEGDRFHCTECEDFDLCTVCYDKEGVKEAHGHKFDKVSALDAVLQTFQNGGGCDAFFRQGEAPRNVHRAICDVCDEAIVGVRHKCIDCADYDECDACFGHSEHTADHAFHSIRDPAQRVVPEEVRRSREEHLAKLHAEAHEKEIRREEKKKQLRELQRERAALDKRLEELEKAKREQKEQEQKEMEKERKELEEKEKEEKKSAPPMTAFEKVLQTLEEMGFSDREKNIKLLVKNKNKLFPTIQALLE